ncbi:hypothetical protein [Marinimicrobium sp. ABcell2]|uniref:hypothetical protein n=1 Tax=Marinimicrobium sp. ABcell2 TaxID=3069751 RepID=UPI0027B0B448|nr:hypothetical protein [Marinimicrobium sp. ABcell2]MDQ2076028.1 hypothetical protein [Marinimicrobium sp. ABcell2]
MAKQQLTFRQKAVFFCGAFMALSLSMGLSLFLLGAFAAGPDEVAEEEAETQAERFRRISMSDAEDACERRARSEFGERIWLLTLDRRSSRLDRKDQQFKLFYESELFLSTARQGQPERYYINCFTAVDRPRVVNFEYSADGYEFGEPGEEERGLFGL